jgi:hypothetical protein
VGLIAYAGKEKKTRPVQILGVCRKELHRKKFNQIGASMYRDKRIQALKPKTFLVYQCCMLESAGQESFKLPADAALRDYGISHGTFQRAMKELREAGFIEIVASGKNLSGPTEYKFSRVWRGESAP